MEMIAIESPDGVASDKDIPDRETLKETAGSLASEIVPELMESNAEARNESVLIREAMAETTNDESNSSKEVRKRKSSAEGGDVEENADKRKRRKSEEDGGNYFAMLTKEYEKVYY